VNGVEKRQPFTRYAGIFGKITNCVAEGLFWEADGRSADHEITRFFYGTMLRRVRYWILFSAT